MKSKNNRIIIILAIISVVFLAILIFGGGTFYCKRGQEIVSKVSPTYTIVDKAFTARVLWYDAWTLILENDGEITTGSTNAKFYVDAQIGDLVRLTRKIDMCGRKVLGRYWEVMEKK